MIELKNVTKIYDKKKTTICTALDNVSLTINDGELVAIVGKSGAGKSTMLNLITLLDKPTTGDIILNGINTKELSNKQSAILRNEHLGIIMQDFALISYYSIMDNITLPITLCKEKYTKRKELVAQLMAKLDMSDIPVKKPITKLSGGQKQRVAIARALINEPNTIIADEPTGSIDEQTSINVMNILKDLHQEGKSVIIVTHDNIIANQCDRIITISQGKVVSDILNSKAE